MHISPYVLMFLLMMAFSTAFSQSTPVLIFPSEPDGSVQLKIVGTPALDKEKVGHESLSVFVQQEGKEYASEPIQGHYSVREDYLVFTPYFPFERGMTYAARIKETQGDLQYVYKAFQIAEQGAPEQAKVVSIYPSASELPENLLRFYFYFNTPMKKGQALDHIQLVDAEGNIDKRAFMAFKEELWSPDGKRFTLLFDPGRIKRGVSTNIEYGPALLEGKRYYLQISAYWQDVYGQELGIDTSKELVVGKAYRQQIEANQWVVEDPSANSTEVLSIQFDRVMDHALLQSMIQVQNQAQDHIAGRWEVAEAERIIQFIPAQAWQQGKYQIIIDSRLEDVAGNNLQNLLDQKETTSAFDSATQQYIEFEVL